MDIRINNKDMYIKQLNSVDNLKSLMKQKIETPKTMIDKNNDKTFMALNFSV